MTAAGLVLTDGSIRQTPAVGGDHTHHEGGVQAGLGFFVIAVIDVFGVTHRKTELFGQTIGPQVGWGLWLVLIASLVLIATSIVVAVQIPKLREDISASSRSARHPSAG
jgi:hypothetical protein